VEEVQWYQIQITFIKNLIINIKMENAILNNYFCQPLSVKDINEISGGNWWGDFAEGFLKGMTFVVDLVKLFLPKS
jgi:hypothetical protein